MKSADDTCRILPAKHLKLPMNGLVTRPNQLRKIFVQAIIVLVDQQSNNSIVSCVLANNTTFLVFS